MRRVAAIAAMEGVYKNAWRFIQYKKTALKNAVLSCSSSVLKVYICSRIINGVMSLKFTTPSWLISAASTNVAEDNASMNG